MAHDSQVNDAEDRNLRIWNRAKHTPNLAFAITRWQPLAVTCQQPFAVTRPRLRVASAERPIAELVPLFSATGHHHIPIVGEQALLVGILTQSDLVKALSHGP